MSVMIGIDPHKGSHTAVVINPDEIGDRPDHVSKASVRQLGELQEWAADYDDRSWAVESARGLGYLLSQQLVASWGTGPGCASDAGITGASPGFGEVSEERSQ